MTPANSIPPRTPFAHQRLRAWEVAIEALSLCDRAAKRLPRGYGPLADQLRRASQSACLQVAEGAAKHGAERAQRFRGARAEATEAAAAIEAAGALGLLAESQVALALDELGKLCAMLVKLERAA